MKFEDTGGRKGIPRKKNIEVILAADDVRDAVAKACPMTIDMMTSVWEDLVRDHGPESAAPGIATAMVACIHCAYQLGLKHGDLGTPIPVSQDLLDHMNQG